MTLAGYENVTAALAAAHLDRPLGRIEGIDGGAVRMSGLSSHAAIGDRVRIGRQGFSCEGEIVSANGQVLAAIPDGSVNGLRPGDPAALLGPLSISPHAGWIGRVVDPQGRPLDGRALLPGLTSRALTGAAPDAVHRRGLGARVQTGLRAMNTLLPLVRGQRIGLFAGSGVGKSTLLGTLARRIEADVVIFAMIGERGREVRDFVSRVLGPEGMARTVVVAATADAPASSRARCLPAALAVAETFRDEGKHVLLLADSITRHAEAHRQVAAVRGEAPSLGGFPASMATELASLCERAGPGVEGQGDITAVFTVLVAGSDMEGPVADALRGVLDGHIVLDRGIAERGRFPAIDLVRSVSRSLPDAAGPQENTLIQEARRLIGAYEKAEMMIQAGLYASGSDRTVDAAIQAWPKLDTFIGQFEGGSVEDSFAALARCLSRRLD
ncbi:FliI/YscN family ATPase [Palleronia sp.]|uniref:FliI/YscN family ATPase n=1 Tax=Palleronia sp. TaxID=1940284 RepID=UPI0035C7B190